MNKIIMVLALFITAMNVCAQESLQDQMKALRSKGFGARNTATVQSTNEAADAARAAENDSLQALGDTDPSFPGGDVFLEAYLKKKVTHSDVSGTGDVVVSFMVDKKGNIYGAEVTQSAGNTLDTAAFNIVTGMPRWRPGYTDGEPADKPAKVTVSFGK